ncbi:hypothetical protein FCL47_09975 [Desulfopila sp. IMCC35006]|uniref:DEAD/DEAH box helicase family protein n=1 Tax=Desulfopila sp. IMCC35006 TaxID=2569542 RepID=UPI0010ABD918|nr:DEAD/DEAH box helicase family protein [Desulfopila sp. IMCC35006]TKB26069.1 hypothetical protein FCL47_09975 [Desulfopila sp. IMCC35006]
MKYIVIDAVMGTGKSTYITLKIKADPESRHIVVLPMLTELKRYEKLLQDIEGLVSLYEGNSKKERFDEALEHAPVILITHALFEKHLNDESFVQVQQGKWKLVMDEVVTAFETVGVTDVDISGLCTLGALTIKEMKPGVDLLQSDPLTFHSFRKADGNLASNTHKALLKDALVKDLYRVTADRGSHYYTFSLQEQRLSVFEEVTILTYPFKDTDLDYWFQIKGIEVEHLELSRRVKTGSLSDFDLQPHSGHYSGNAFKDRIEFLEPPVVRGKTRYGHWNNHFSAESMRKNFKPRKKSQEGQIIVNELRTLFRNKRGRMVEPDDFMFTCLADSMLAFRDSKNGLTKEFISDETFVAFNKRATNGYSHKHHLAYLYNVFPFPPIVKMIEAHGLKYNAERWALYILIQWIWRSAIRNDEKIYLYLPSKRMRKILEDWLNA